MAQAGEIMKVNRCIYCFAPLEEEPENEGQAEKRKKGHREPCPVCGYEDGLCMSDLRRLLPGTLLRGSYMVGKLLVVRKEELIYLGFDLDREQKTEIHEYFPESILVRDVSASDEVHCVPGMEARFAKGQQAFFEKVKLYYQCTSRIKKVQMDFFVRNGTCYYVREREEAQKGGSGRIQGVEL